MIRTSMILVIFMAMVASVSCSDTSKKAPVALERCVKCHGRPGSGGTKSAPDLASSTMTLEQMKSQVRSGSKWEGRPPKNPLYRTKRMPPQLKVSDKEIEQIYNFVHAE